MDSVSAQGDGSRWSAILAQLEGRRLEMADEFVARLDTIEGYGAESNLVDSQDAHHVCMEALRLILESMASGHTEDGLLSFGIYVGSKRARDGVDADSVTTAVRMVFSVIWSRISEICGPQDAPLLVGRVEVLWNVIDDYARQSHASYLFERVKQAREESELRQSAIAALFAGSVTTPEGLRRTASILRIEPDCHLNLAAADHRYREALLQFASSISPASRVVTHTDFDATFVLWPSHSSSKKEETPTLPPAGSAFMTDVRGLAAVRHSALLCAALADLALAEDTTPLTVDSHWARLARIGLTDRGVDLAGRLSEEMSNCSEAEYERLRETAMTFLASGNIAATAAALFCHRNTILTRIRRFKELTALDLTLPEHAAQVLVAWT
jgi:PucR-like helix-turn-helix protein